MAKERLKLNEVEKFFVANHTSLELCLAQLSNVSAEAVTAHFNATRKTNPKEVIEARKDNPEGGLTAYDLLARHGAGKDPGQYGGNNGGTIMTPAASELYDESRKEGLRGANPSPGSPGYYEKNAGHITRAKRA